MTGRSMGARLLLLSLMTSFLVGGAGAGAGWGRAGVLPGTAAALLPFLPFSGGELERGERVRSITEGGPTDSLSESGTLISTGSLMGPSTGGGVGRERSSREGGRGSVGESPAELLSLGKSAKMAAASARV